MAQPVKSVQTGLWCQRPCSSNCSSHAVGRNPPTTSSVSVQKLKNRTPLEWTRARRASGQTNAHVLLSEAEGEGPRGSLTVAFAHSVDGLSADGARASVLLQLLRAREACALVARLAVHDDGIGHRIHANHTLVAVVSLRWRLLGICLAQPRLVVSRPPHGDGLYPTSRDGLCDTVLEIDGYLSPWKHRHDDTLVRLHASTLIAWTLEVRSHDVANCEVGHPCLPVGHSVCNPRLGHVLHNAIIEVQLCVQS
mmetsp:Transcript_44323/g.117561  ORF Transcript_44323/g.117561 Transcript_44323/m.117561 type:complete len:252 (-) Transcript_44323:986-1741(-)